MGAALATLRLPGFRRLAAAYTVNELGDWLGDVALAILVFDQTGSPLATAALFLGSRFLPALFAPALVARLELSGARRSLPALYLAEAACFVALAAVAGSFSLIAVIALALVDGTFAVAARALTRAAATQVLVPHGRLREGNAVMNVGFTAAGALGPAVAGLTVAWLGVSGALLLDAASFLVAGAVLLATRGLPGRQELSAAGLGGRARDGLRYVLARPIPRVLLGGQALALVFFAAVIPIEVVYVKETFGGTDAQYGALLASWGVGMVAGSMLFVLAGRRSLPLMLVVSTAAIGLAYLGLAAAPVLALAFAASAVGGMGNGVQWVALVSALQEATDGPFQARVLALLEACGAAMPGVGFLIGGLIAAVASPRASYLAAGLGTLTVLAGAAMLLSRVGFRGPVARQSAPAPAEAA